MLRIPNQTVATKCPREHGHQVSPQITVPIQTRANSHEQQLCKTIVYRPQNMLSILGKLVKLGICVSLQFLPYMFIKCFCL